MKKILLGLLTLVAAISLAACDSGVSTNVFEFVLDESFDEFLVMETSADYPPFENVIISKDGNYVEGVDIEIAKAIALKAGKNLKVVHKGFDFLITDIQDGKADFTIAAITPTPDRMKIVDFSTPYLSGDNDQVAVIKTADANKYKTIADVNLATVKVGAQTGSLQSYILQDETPKSTALYLQDLSTLYEYLSNNNIQALLSEKTVAETYITTEYSDLMIAFDVDCAYSGNAVAVQKGNTALLNIINETIAELTAAGQVQAWIDYYSALYAE